MSVRKYLHTNDIFFSQAVPIIILEKRLGGAACVI